MVAWTDDLTELADGRFQIRRVVGQGATATVYAALDTRLKVERAVKVLAVPETVRHTLRQRLEAEARAMSALDHPNILQILDIGDDGARTWVVMRLADGGSLAEQVAQHGPMPPSIAIRYMLQVLAALDAAHRAGIVHRDVKPHNILLDRHGTALLCDFGIALLTEEAARTTRTGVAMGSMAFMAPEQRIDARSVSPAADVYAVAATFYNLLTDANPMDLFAARPGSPRWLGVPDDIQDVLRAASAYEPSERFQTARELAAELVALLPNASEFAATQLPDDGLLPLLQSPRPADAPTYPVYPASDAATEMAIDALTGMPELVDDPITTPPQEIAQRRPAPFATAEPRPVVPSPRRKHPSVWGLPILAVVIGTVLGLTRPWEEPAEPTADHVEFASTRMRPPPPANEPTVDATAVGEPDEPTAVTQPPSGDDAEPRAAAAPAVETVVPQSTPPDRPAVGGPSGDDVAPEASSSNTAAAAAAGRWKGAVDGRPIDVRLSGAPRSMRGVATFRFGDRSQTVGLSGRYDPTSRMLVLTEDIDDDSRGEWRLALTDDGGTLEGTYVRLLDNSTRATALRRTE